MGLAELAALGEVTNAFTVDLEDWYQGLELSVLSQESFENRLHVGTYCLLDLFEKTGTQVTFFALGAAVERAPELLQEIYARGHEIGSHGYSHQFVYRLGKEGFRQDLQRSLEILDKVLSHPVIGYRAPFFSITRQTPWAFEILAENGIRYDSSIFPVHNYRYGIPDAPRWIHSVNAGVVEFPLSTYRFLGCNIPLSGGAYFRLFPYTFTKYGFRAINAKGRPGVFYIHPWELDPLHPRLDLPRRIRMPHYWNLARTESRLLRLLREFRFAPMGQVLGLHVGSARLRERDRGSRE